MEPLISVIIPVYNVSRYLHQCVDSVINQTYKNIEIILVDDGSTDASAQICDEYAAADRRICCVHKSNGGLSSARNYGIEQAAGDYVYFLDSDDFIIADAIQAAVTALVESGADLAFFDAKCFEDEGTKEIPQTYIRKKKYSNNTGIETVKALIRNKDFKYSACLYLVCRSLLLENNLNFIDGILYEDMDFTFKAFFYAKRITHVNRQLYMRRCREGSIMTSGRGERSFLSACTVYDSISGFAAVKSISTDDSICMYTERCAFAVFNCYDQLNPDSKRKYYDKLCSAKAIMKKNNYHKSRALKARCYGKLPWAVARSLEKLGF